MAKCDQGYLCVVCGEPVERLAESSLYLQLIIGWIDPETLHLQPESHLRCNPPLAQFIDDDRFAPIVCEGPLDRRNLDADFVAQRTELVTRGYRRLQEVARRRRDLTILDYLLPEAKRRWEG
ncbi:MAG: hypothetical protein KatS3mg111_2927 [Pirellulaceae bacterium]|nr:MAG: hypothetical protein KatS3mg111_2927 [Pirellulaceae bacterium]